MSQPPYYSSKKPLGGKCDHKFIDSANCLKCGVSAVALNARLKRVPRFQCFEPVYVEGKPGGVCHVKDVEETAPGVYRYLIERTETFFAHEQSLAKVPPKT